MRDRLVELLYRAHHNASCVMNEGGSEEEILEEEARYLLKYGVILPPCKVGDTVWFIQSRGKIIETTVEKIILKNGGLYLKLLCNSFYETTCRSIGKTIFFTRKEAELALKGE